MRISISHNNREGRYLGKIAGVGHARVDSMTALICSGGFFKLINTFKFKGVR